MKRMSVSSRRLLLGGTALALAALGTSQVAAHRRAEPAEPPLVVDEVVLPLIADMPSVSGDGHLIAYAGRPAEATDQRVRTIWLRDTVAGTVTELTPLIAGARAGESAWPVLSTDGCSVTFLTQVPFDLFRDDDGGSRWDVYRQQLPACGGTLGDLELVSVRGTGFDVAAADDVVPTDRPAVSADGSVVAYTREFGLSAHGVTAVMVVDLAVAAGESGRARPVAGTPLAAPTGPFLYSGQRQPSISDDGLLVAFTSDADSAAAEPSWGAGPETGGPATSRVYVWNRTVIDPATAVVDVSSVPRAGTGDAHSPSLSGDGLFVAFVSTAPGLVANTVLPPCTPQCLPQVYLYGRADQSLRLVSHAAAAPGAPLVGADAGATQPELGYSDGEVLFVSRATNLFPTRSPGGGGAADGDIVRAVPATGEVHRVSVLADGVSPAPAANSHPRMSSTGRVVVFDTLAGGVYGDASLPGRQVAVLTMTPHLELADLDMGTVDVDMPSAEWFLVLVNRGPSSFQPASVTLDVADDFLLNGGTCVDGNLMLSPGASCTINALLVPMLPGLRTATLTVAEAGYAAASVSATLSGSGGPGALVAEPGGGYTGSLPVGTLSAPVGFDVLNYAADTQPIDSITLAGEHPQDFAISADGCTGIHLVVGQKCNLQVTFTPTAAGRRNATVVVSTGATYATYLVSGDGTRVPVMTAVNPTLVAGSRLSVAGSGFSPNTAVVLMFADGSGSAVTVMSDATGAIVATLLVRANDRSGDRVLVAQTASGEVGRVAVRVLPPAAKLSPGSPAWPGR